MKKSFPVLFMFLIAGTPLMAQPEAGHFTITPTAGVSSCTVTNHPEIDFVSYLQVHTGGKYIDAIQHTTELNEIDKEILLKSLSVAASSYELWNLK